ncbi:MAG: hypothetical protein ACTSW1_06325 [Candidatus Hodarchaeales archaeon]
MNKDFRKIVQDQQCKEVLGLLTLSNIALFYSFFRIEWFVLSFFIIVGLEALIINYSIKDGDQATRISLAGNILSTIVAIPLLTFPILDITKYIPIEGGWSTHGPDTYSLWLVPITYGFSLVKNIPTSPPIEYDLLWSDFPTTILVFTLAMFFSFLIELGYAVIDSKYIKKAKVETSWHKPVFLANIVSYSVIICSLIALGIFLGLFLNISDPIGFLSEKLFVNSNYNFSELFGYFLSYMIVILLILGFVGVVLLIGKRNLGGKDKRD